MTPKARTYSVTGDSVAGKKCLIVYVDNVPALTLWLNGEHTYLSHRLRQAGIGDDNKLRALLTTLQGMHVPTDQWPGAIARLIEEQNE